MVYVKLKDKFKIMSELEEIFCPLGSTQFLFYFKLWREESS